MDGCGRAHALQSWCVWHAPGCPCADISCLECTLLSLHVIDAMCSDGDLADGKQSPFSPFGTHQ